MKQPEDTKTIDLLQAEKRGRGRPPVENPLTPAERAKRYRDRKRWDRQCMETRMRVDIPLIEQESKSVTVPPVTKKDNYETFLLKLKIQQLENDLASYRKFDDQRRDLDDHVQRQFDEVNRQLKESNDYIADLVGALDEVVQVSSSGKRVPAHLVKGLVKLLARA